MIQSHERNHTLAIGFCTTKTTKILEEYKRIENIIYQRKVDPSRVQDSLNKVKVEISDAKKEEEEN